MTEQQERYHGNGPGAAAPAWRSADPESCREAMSRIAAGVVVLMTRDASGGVWGFTATSLCSVSLDPPLVLACVALSSRSYPAFMSCDSFTVSVLRKNHVAVADRLARGGPDKFRAEALALSPRRRPTLAGALCRFECRVYARHHAGDHVIVVGQISEVSIGAGEPLLYFHRNYRAMNPQALEVREGNSRIRPSNAEGRAL